MLLCNECVVDEEGGCCYARSMSWLKRVDAAMQGVFRGRRGWIMLCNEYVVAEEGGCCYAMSMSWLKRVDHVMQ